MADAMADRPKHAGSGAALPANPLADPLANALANPLDGLLGYRLRRASMAMMADLIAALRPLGLSPGEASFLILIGANPGCAQSDVGRALDIKRANLTPLVARMKARGLVGDAPIDGRSRSLTLTAEGIALRDRALRRVLANEQRFREGLDIDAAKLLAVLRIIAG